MRALMPEAVMFIRLPEQLQMFMISKKQKTFFVKMMKSVTVIPDTAELKCGRRSRRMNIFEILSFEPMSDHPVLRSHPAIRASTGIKRSRTRSLLAAAKQSIPFLIVKRQFGYAKLVYRGIAKNMNRFHILFASTDLV